MPDTASTLDIIGQALKNAPAPGASPDNLTDAPASEFDQKLDILKAGAAGKPLPKDIIGTPVMPGDDYTDSSGIHITIRPKQRIPAGTVVGNQPPPVANGPSIGDVLKSGTEEGLGGLAGMPADLAQLGGNAGVSTYNWFRDQLHPDPNSLFTKPVPSEHAAPIGPLPGGSDWIYRQMEGAGMTPRATFNPIWAKYLKAATAGATGVVPTLAIPGAGEVRLGRALGDLATGAGTGVASLAGQDAARVIDPNNPGLQTAAGLAAGFLPGGASSVARMAARPFGEAGQRVIAGNILAKEGRGAAIPPTGNLPTGFRPTVGQVSNAPGFVRLERTMEQNPEVGPEFQIQQQANQQALRDNLDLLRSGRSSDDASMAMNHGVRAYKNAMKAQESALWQGIDPNNTAPQVTGVYRQRVAAAIAKEPVAYQKLIPTSYADDLARLPYNANVHELHAILSQMKEDARVAGYAGEANKARAIGNVAKMFEQELVNQMLRANPAVRQRFRAANAVSRHNAETYKQNPIGNVLAKDNTGAPRTQPTAVAGKLLGSGAGQAERWAAFKKSVNNNPHAIAAARDWFVSKMIDAVVKSDGMLSPADFEKFIKANRALLASDIFSPGQKSLLDRIQRAAKMAQNTAKGGPKGHASTAADLMGNKYVDVLIGKWTGRIMHVAGAGVGAVVGHALGAQVGEVGGLLAGFKGAEYMSHGMDKLYAMPAQRVRDLLRDALLDPDLARDLMQEAKKSARLPVTLARYLANDLALNLAEGGLPADRPAAAGTTR